MSGLALFSSRAKPPQGILIPESPERVRRRARWVQRELDYELRRLEGRKRFGMVWLSAAVLILALIVTPVGWVWSLREEGPAGGPVLLAEAASHTRIVHRPIPLSEMDPDLVRAVIAATDPGFCARAGAAPPDRLERAVAERVFLWAAPSGLRGAMADFLAGWIDVLWSKPRIAEVYLNTAPWGDGLVGAEAAAQGRYGLSAGALDRVHHALPLAAALDQPQAWRERGSTPALRQRVSTLARELRELERLNAFSCLNSELGAQPTA